MNGLTPGFWLASGACASCGASVSQRVPLPGDHPVTCPSCSAVTTLSAEFHVPPMLGRLPWGRRRE